MKHALPECLSFNVTAPMKVRKSVSNGHVTAITLTLQCDRTDEGAEIPFAAAAVKPISELQCDRTDEGAEILATKTTVAEFYFRFNVTAPMKVRKSGSHHRRTSRIGGFNVTAPMKVRK